MQDQKEKEKTRFCFVIVSRNGWKYFPACMESIMNQKYNNWTLHYLDDFSEDGSYVNISKYVDGLEPQLQAKIHLFQAPARQYAAYNRDWLIRNSGEKEDTVIFLVDGDDRLAPDPDILNFMNDVYRKEEGVWITYGGYETSTGKRGNWGSWSKNNFDTRGGLRKSWFGGHPRTFRKWLYELINVEDLKDENGEFLKVATDLAIMIPMLEMAGWTHSRYINNRILYIYTVETVPGAQYDPLRVNEQKRVQQWLYQKKSPYSQILE